MESIEELNEYLRSKGREHEGTKERGLRTLAGKIEAAWYKNSVASVYKITYSELDEFEKNTKAFCYTDFTDCENSIFGSGKITTIYSSNIFPEDEISSHINRNLLKLTKIDENILDFFFPLENNANFFGIEETCIRLANLYDDKHFSNAFGGLIEEDEKVLRKCYEELLKILLPLSKKEYGKVIFNTKMMSTEEWSTVLKKIRTKIQDDVLQSTTFSKFTRR